MRRYTHYCTGTIISQYIVSNPDRDFLAVYGVHAVGARKYACFFFICHTVNGRFCRCFVAVFFYGILLLCGCQCSQTFIFGSQHHKGTAVQCIRSCGVNSDFFISAFDWELNQPQHHRICQSSRSAFSLPYHTNPAYSNPPAVCLRML